MVLQPPGYLLALTLAGALCSSACSAETVALSCTGDSAHVVRLYVDIAAKRLAESDSLSGDAGRALFSHAVHRLSATNVTVDKPAGAVPNPLGTARYDFESLGLPKGIILQPHIGDLSPPIDFIKIETETISFGWIDKEAESPYSISLDDAPPIVGYVRNYKVLNRATGVLGVLEYGTKYYLQCRKIIAPLL